MGVLAFFAWAGALCWAGVVLYANGMRSSPGSFQGGGTVTLGFVVAVAITLAWWLG